MITREDKLWSMTGAMLIKEADKLGVKVSANKTRTQLKESKQNVIDRILAFEVSQVDEVNEVEEDVTVEHKLVPMPGIEKLEELKKEYSHKEDVAVEEVVETVVDTESELTDEDYAKIGLEIAEQAKENARNHKKESAKITLDLNILSDRNLEFTVNSRGSIIVKLKPANIEICVKKSKIVLYCRNNIISGVKVGCKFKRDNIDIESFKEVLDAVIQN